MFRHFGAKRQNTQKNLNWSNVDNVYIVLLQTDVSIILSTPFIPMRVSKITRNTLISGYTKEISRAATNDSFPRWFHLLSENCEKMSISVSENQRWRPQIQFTVTEKKRNHKIFTFKKLESENVDSTPHCGSGTIFDIVISRNMRPQSQRQLGNISTWLPEREVAKQDEGGREGRVILVKYRGNFIYICKRHHLEYCKPPTPRRATLGCAPESQQSGPGSDPIAWKENDRVCKQSGRQRSKFSSGSSSVSLGNEAAKTSLQRSQTEPSASSPGRGGGWTFLGRCNATTAREDSRVVWQPRPQE